MEVQIDLGYAIHYGGLHVFTSSCIGKQALDLGLIEQATSKFGCEGKGCWQLTKKANA